MDNRTKTLKSFQSSLGKMLTVKMDKFKESKPPTKFQI